MENKRRALGKGLEQLFNAENLNFDQIENDIIESSTKDEIINVRLDDLRNNPYQPRKVFDEKALNELAESIKENGVFQPIIVKKSIKGYEIIAGERRVKACRKLDMETIPAIVRDFTDEEMMQIALLENLQRENLNAIEEAEAYKAIINSLQITQEELGKKLGKSRSHITNMVGLLKLPDSIQDLVLHNKLSMGHARILSKLNDIKQIETLAKKTVNEDLSVRQLEKLTTKTTNKEETKQRQQQPNEYYHLEGKIKELLGTNVKIRQNKMQISFTSNADLNRILEILNIDIEK
ncbi:MAG: ParB/RepB/Spo0J family partition protein [Bacilli bacterium]|nr:ParB/RepB/Spo0J family partition protein [Bacilli bacterium]